MKRMLYRFVYGAGDHSPLVDGAFGGKFVSRPPWPTLTEPKKAIAHRAGAYSKVQCEGWSDREIELPDAAGLDF